MLKKPKRLEAGSRIVFASPSRAPEYSAALQAAHRFQQLGYEVVIPPDLCDSHGYLAGEDQARADRLNVALLDPAARLVLCMVGGYGAMRLLPLLDWDNLANREVPPLFVGFSDITALHTAFRKRLGWVTFHGPMGMTTWGGVEPPESSYSDHILNVLGAREPDLDAFWPIPFMTHPVPTAFVSGSAEGRLCGGNLALITALMGTPWEIETAGAILLLEDVGEEPYRIDRMLCQLALAGKLRKCAGIVLGGWTQCAAENPDRSLTLKEVLWDHLGGLGIPVLAGWPSGHFRRQLMMPLGVPVRLETEDLSGRFLRMLESPWEDTSYSGSRPEMTDMPV